MAGIVFGTGDLSALTMNYVPNVQPVVAGDIVLTTGGDGIYPPGLPIGTVEAVGPSDVSSWTIRVSPAVDFGAIQHVLIVIPSRDEDVEASLISGGAR